jgi:hypothetical protein
MGAFIPSPNDQEIIAKLNFLFSGATLAQIKAFTDKNGKPLFPAKNLSRVARRIGAYPNTTSDSNGRNPRARWFVFLENLPGSTKHDINTLLAAANRSALHTREMQRSASQYDHLVRPCRSSGGRSPAPRQGH